MNYQELKMKSEADLLTPLLELGSSDMVDNGWHIQAVVPGTIGQCETVFGKMARTSAGLLRPNDGHV